MSQWSGTGVSIESGVVKRVTFQFGSGRHTELAHYAATLLLRVLASPGGAHLSVKHAHWEFTQIRSWLEPLAGVGPRACDTLNGPNASEPSDEPGAVNESPSTLFEVLA